MTSAPHPAQSEKARIYRAYQKDEATKADVYEVFGVDFTEFEEFDRLMDVVRDSITNAPSDDLYC